MAISDVDFEKNISLGYRKWGHSLICGGLAMIGFTYILLPQFHWYTCISISIFGLGIILFVRGLQTSVAR